LFLEIEVLKRVNIHTVGFFPRDSIMDDIVHRHVENATSTRETDVYSFDAKYDVNCHR